MSSLAPLASWIAFQTSTSSSTVGARGFQVTLVLADNQFESMRGELADLGILLNMISADEHVQEMSNICIAAKIVVSP